MKIQFQFALSYVSRAIDAAEEVLPLFEAKHLGDSRPRKAIDLAKQWFSLMQQGGEAQARQMKKQLRNAANAAANAANAPYAATAHAAADAAADAAYAAAHAAANAAARAVAYAEKAKGNDWSKVREIELRWQNEEAARLINTSKGEIFWEEDAAIFLMGKMNLQISKNEIQMIKAREVLL